MDGGRHKEMARTREITKYNEGEIVWKMRFRRKMDGREEGRKGTLIEFNLGYP